MYKNVLILAPHTDDGELGCGGTIARLLEEGSNVYYVAFSTCKESVPNGCPLNILEIELKKAMKKLGVPEDNIIIYDYPVRRFCEWRQDILDRMIELNTKIHPDCVFSTSPRDIHQDHSVIAYEAMRAYKKTTLFCYEVPWNNFEFHNQAYIGLEQRHVAKKVDAIKCYDTQKKRAYTSREFTYGQAKVHGVQVGVPYAEVFEVIRWIS